MITERIDHTLLRADATEEDIRGLCEEAVTYGFHSVCVNSSCVALCASLLKNTGIKVCTVIGFPLGAMSTTAKIAEATAAVATAIVAAIAAERTILEIFMIKLPLLFVLVGLLNRSLFTFCILSLYLFFVKRFD